jgi:hypothetical protein
MMYCSCMSFSLLLCLFCEPADCAKSGALVVMIWGPGAALVFLFGQVILS